MNASRAIVAVCLAVGAQAAFAADSVFLTQPRLAPLNRTSNATDSKAYKVDAAKHIYEAYAPRIYKGKLPPLIHGVVVVETTVDAAGNARDVHVVRGPSHAPDVTSAVVEMIRRASPLPVPSPAIGGFRFTEVWLVNKDGRFQLDSLSEGQVYAGR